MRFFKIGLILARKWIRMNQMSTPPFWGCFGRFLESVLRFGRLKSHFLALENGHFCTFAHLKVSCSRKSGISVKDLSLPTKYKNQRDDLFGEKGQSDSVKVDNLHLRGRKGKQIYTESMVRLANSLKGGRARSKVGPKSKVQLPRLKSTSMRLAGKTCSFRTQSAIHLAISMIPILRDACRFKNG